MTDRTEEVPERGEARRVKPKKVNVGGMLFVGIFSKRVFWAPRVMATPRGDGTALYEVVGNKRDVTDMFEDCARELGWTPPVNEELRSVLPTPKAP